jgi:glycosyltransferase involved in cell wall biosynthesis
LSLFLVDAGQEWRNEQQQGFFLAQELHKKGYPFHFVIPRESPLHRALREKGLPALPLNTGGGRSLSLRLRLAAAMKRRRAVLIHFLDSRAFAAGFAAASLAGVPIRVLSRRADLPAEIPRKALKDIDAVIASTEGVKAVLTRGGIPGDHVEVVPGGMDFSSFREIESRDFLHREFSFAADDFLVGMVAPLEDQKGYNNLMETARIIRLNAPKIQIVILGEGSLRVESDKSARVEPAAQVSFFLGFSEAAPEVLASLDVFVVSSPMEGLRSSLMQALACGLPVVATEVGRIPDLVVHRETGLLVPPRRPKALADAVLKLFMDPKLASRLANRGSEAVHEKYSAEAMAGRIIAAYEKAASRKGVKLG